MSRILRFIDYCAYLGVGLGSLGIFLVCAIHDPEMKQAGIAMVVIGTFSVLWLLS